MRLLIILFFLPIVVFGQSKDYQLIKDQDSLKNSSPVYHYNYKKIIIPAVFVGYGVASLFSEELIELNTSTRYETREHISSGSAIDNYMQYAPAAAVYGLNSFGINGKHNLRDRTILYAGSQLILAAIVMPGKKLIAEERPDGSNRLSFPSGHTATAFSSAQFLFREYQGRNFWLSISGYPIAAATGIYRILNDRHWVGDVVAGAGIGILSTELSYWMFPYTSHLLHSKRNHDGSLFISPTYHDHEIGFAMVKNF